MRITKVEAGWKNSKAKGFLQHSGQLPGEEHLGLFVDPLVALASECCQDRTLVRLETKQSAGGKWYVTAIRRVESGAKGPDQDHREMVHASDIAF